MSVENRFKLTRPVFVSPFWGGPVEFQRDLCRQKTKVYHWRCLRDPTFVTDGRTDGRTQGHSIYGASMASGGRNWFVLLQVVD